MSKSKTQTLSPSQVHDLVTASCDDAFALLGMHVSTSPKGVMVRCLLPGALSVAVIARKGDVKVAALKQIHPEGLFEGKMGRRIKVFDYYLQVQYPLLQSKLEDPYRFTSLLEADEMYLFGEGTQEKAYRCMGAFLREIDAVKGTLFVVWAPNAKRVSVVGDFNNWDRRQHMMRKHPSNGVWEMFVPHLIAPTTYKYDILSASGQSLPLKADPYAQAMQGAPDTASVSHLDSHYPWQDEQWLKQRAHQNQHHNQAVCIYEVHLGSWRRNSAAQQSYLSYRQLADQLIPYAIDLGFTHIQLMPVSEFPFDGSWGYQPIGLFAPTCRFGSPDDFKYFIDQCHQQGLGVLLDWVPGHFPTDEHGLVQFDGSYLYEHADIQKGFHPDWNTLIYNYGRAEVISFLMSNAMFWLEEYHLDGLRVDAVASMLYLDYSRKGGEWSPNIHGGRENLEAIELLRQVNSRVYFNHPGVMMIAEESTAWPGVSKPVDQGGLGFGFKWNMGWMNDTLQYMKRDPIHRKHHHNEMTFGLVYAFSENFVLPLSHDEVVHGKGSLLSKMPGDNWQKFANLRAYLGFMWGHPGKKLLFMGGEFAQVNEWNHDQSLDWHLLENPAHSGVQSLLRDLNVLYRREGALHQTDSDGSGFEWLDFDNAEHCVFAFLRKGFADSAPLMVISNFTPTVHHDYRVGVPLAGRYVETLNTDSVNYGGSNLGNFGALHSIDQAWGGHPFQLCLSLPPLSTLFFTIE